MIYSKTTEYAIHALAYLASNENPGGIQAISKIIKVPPAYASKIFQGLVHARILDSKSGAAGGYYLRQKPSELKLVTIIRAVDNKAHFDSTECVMGLTQCGCDNPCPLHDVWAETKARMGKILEETTLLDVIQKVVLKKTTKRQAFKLSKKMRLVLGQSKK